MKSIAVENFHLQHTIESGQCFRYRKEEGGYTVNASDKQFFVKQVGNKLLFSGIDAEFVKNYFRLDVDYASVLSSINKDEHISAAINSCKGLRLLKQDPWECIVSFICSSNANIPKIQMNLRLLVETFGKDGKFPEIGSLNDLEKIRSTKAGYRSKYLFAANKLVTKKFISEVKSLPYLEAKEKIKSIPGIGDKVADCILLFSFGFDNAFPVDTWMEKVLYQKYRKRKAPIKKLQTFGQKYFGANAGWAQQYLFHWMRTQHINI